MTAIGIFSALPIFWYLPTTFLAGSGAAASIALVNTIGASAGLAAPCMTGWLLDITGSCKAGLWVVGAFMAMAVALLLVVRSRLTPVVETGSSASVDADEKNAAPAALV